MYRIILIFITVISLSGCVYRRSDVPVVQFTNVSPENLYIHASSDKKRFHSWYGYVRLAADLEEAGFRPSIVSDLSILPDGSFLVEDVELSKECFSEPLLNVLTFGVIPHIGCSTYGYKFKIRRKGDPNTVDVNAKFKVKVMVGWLTWPVAFSKSYAYDGDASATKEINAVAVMLLRREVKNALRN